MLLLLLSSQNITCEYYFKNAKLISSMRFLPFISLSEMAEKWYSPEPRYAATWACHFSQITSHAYLLHVFSYKEATALRLSLISLYWPASAMHFGICHDGLLDADGI